MTYFRHLMVGARGFEPPTSCSQGRRANQTALRPESMDTRGLYHYHHVILPSRKKVEKPRHIP
jgi:hypothetical protein